MPFPEYEDMEEPFLCYIFFNGGSEYAVRADTTYEPLADFFDLTKEERTRSRPDRPLELHWHNRVQWTRQRLINQGDLDGRKRGIWKLTDQGLKRASSVASRHMRLKIQ
jgi:restriction system protein